MHAKIHGKLATHSFAFFARWQESGWGGEREREKVSEIEIDHRFVMLKRMVIYGWRSIVHGANIICFYVNGLRSTRRELE